MIAETASLFRHALLGDAACQLQLPGGRARLHLADEKESLENSVALMNAECARAGVPPFDEAGA